MRLGHRGVTMIELIFAMGLGLTILAIGYRTYAGMSKVQEVETRREEVMLTAQNLMSKIKQDTRSASQASVANGVLTLKCTDGTIIYSNVIRDYIVVRTTSNGRAMFKGIHAMFSAQVGGVNIRLESESVVRRRPIRVEISSFVSPRNL